MPDFEVTEAEENAPAKKSKEDSYETPYFAYGGASAKAEPEEKSRKPLLIIAE